MCIAPFNLCNSPTFSCAGIIPEIARARGEENFYRHTELWTKNLQSIVDPISLNGAVSILNY